MTYLGIAGGVIGLAAAIYGFITMVKVISPGIMMMVGGICCAIGSNPTTLMVHGSPATVKVGLLLMVFAAVTAVSPIKEAIVKNKAAREALKLEIGGSNMDKFFTECVLADANDFSSAESTEKAAELARKYSLDTEKGLKALYDEAFENHKKITEKLKEQ